MTAETIIGLVIVLICALPFIVMGIVQMKSKKPVGFWSGKEPPAKDEVTDVLAYNKKHGVMWIIYGLGAPASWLVGALFGGGVAFAAAVCAEVVGGIAVMIWYHNYLDRKYVKK